MLQGGVLTPYFLLQVKLHNDENGQQKNDAENERRQGIDEARPVVHAAFAAANPCERHCRYLIFLIRADLHARSLGVQAFSSTARSTDDKIEFTVVSCCRLMCRSSLISRCCSAWLSSQPRIVCCSRRIC